jgi:DNA invertase Pin-like site-specific DNA recombinase
VGVESPFDHHRLPAERSGDLVDSLRVATPGEVAHQGSKGRDMSVVDQDGLLAEAEHDGWALIALDLGLDLSTPSGEVMAHVVAAVAQFERRLIGQRTKDALAVRRAQGLRLGRPPVLPAEVADRIVSERRAGRPLAAIADGLRTDGVATAHGGATWWPSTVAQGA